MQQIAAAAATYKFSPIQRRDRLSVSAARVPTARGRTEPV